MVAISIGVWRVGSGQGGVADTGSDCDGECGWDDDAPKREEEDLP